MKDTRYWLSWFQPGDDFRPMTYPPNASVLGWWKSGITEYGSTLCALVREQSESLAWSAIEQDWPDMEDKRFCEDKGSLFLPGDRFPLSDWMKERITNA